MLESNNSYHMGDTSNSYACVYTYDLYVRDDIIFADNYSKLGSSS